MFVCGDDPRARPTVLQLVAELGFDAVDAGPLKVARLLEPLAMLWIRLARDQGLGREIAFGAAAPGRPRRVRAPRASLAGITEASSRRHVASMCADR